MSNATSYPLCPLQNHVTSTKSEALNSILGTAVDRVRDMSIIHATTPTSQTQHTCSSDGWAFWSSAQKTVSHPLARADRGAHPLARCALLLPCAKNTLVYCHQQRRLSQKECQRQSYLRLLHFLKLRLKVFRISIVLISVTADATKKRRRKLECVCFCLLFNCWLLFPNNNTFFLII